MPQINKPLGLPEEFKVFDDNGMRLEKQFHEPYNQWKAAPNPDSANNMLKSVQPIVDKALRQYVGPNPSPTIRGRAKVLTLQALESYDPNRAQLNTHLLSQLQSLRRASAREERVMSVPEQVSLDWRRLYDAENEVRQELGREPSDSELADSTGLSLKRMQYVRQLKATIPEGTFTQQTADGEMFSPAVSGFHDQEGQNAWVEFVYQDLDNIDKVILEHSLGMHGRPKLSNQQIAAKLGISPAAISQRRTRIQGHLDQREELGVI